VRSSTAAELEQGNADSRGLPLTLGTRRSSTPSLRRSCVELRSHPARWWSLSGHSSFTGGGAATGPRQCRTTSGTPDDLFTRPAATSQWLCDRLGTHLRCYRVHCACGSSACESSCNAALLQRGWSGGGRAGRVSQMPGRAARALKARVYGHGQGRHNASLRMRLCFRLAP